MKTHKLTIEIDAPREKVWEALWTDEHYRDWTSHFSDGSYAESQWQEGGKVYFLIPPGVGMYSIIEELRPNEYMLFRHIGEVKDGREMPPAEWEGANESYLLEDNNGRTVLTASVDTDGDEWENSLMNSFPKALNRLKEIAEMA